MKKILTAILVLVGFMLMVTVLFAQAAENVNGRT